MNKPIRQEILERGVALTTGDRNVSYGDPIDNLGLAGLLKQVFWQHQETHGKRIIGPAEREAIDQVFTKLGRLGTGSQPGRDTYVDGATYFAIAGEVAEQWSPPS